MAAAVLWACASESASTEATTSTSAATTGAGGGTVDGAELSAPDYFAAKVFPEFSLTCGACHTSEENCVPKFMENEPSPTYELMRQHPGLIVPPDSSNLRLYGAHSGPNLTATQDETVRIWLSKEFPDDTGENSQRLALRALGDCMSETDYEDSAFNALAHQQTADAGPCGACHKTGEAGTWIGFNAADMYDKTKKLPYIQRLFRAKFDGSTFVGFGPSTRLFDKPEFAAQCGERHPQGLIDPQKRVATETYIQDALDAYASGNCQ